MTTDTHQKLFIFGFGYTAGALAQRLEGYRIAGTRKTASAPENTGAAALAPFDGSARNEHVVALLADATHVLVSIPPGSDGDPVLRHFAADLLSLKSLEWIGYLSTIGVYGDAAGRWIDEDAPVQPTNGRSRSRADAELAWRNFASGCGKRLEIFRLAGIYGPGRSAVDNIRAGTAHRIVKPGQVFNRIHVADIAAVLHRAMDRATRGGVSPHDIYNVVDDEPAPPQDVVKFAAQLLNMSPPVEQPFGSTTMSPMALSFYAENKRVGNSRLKSDFGITLRYPTYREGLTAIIEFERQDGAPSKIKI